MQKTNNYQDVILTSLRRNQTPAVVFLMNGFQMKGYIRAFDNFVVVLTTEGRQQMIYKHAISTIVPATPVRLEGDETTELQGT